MINDLLFIVETYAIYYAIYLLGGSWVFWEVKQRPLSTPTLVNKPPLFDNLFLPPLIPFISLPHLKIICSC